MRNLRRVRRDSRKYRDVTDAMLVQAMRCDDRWAWAEYFARFYPPLEEYARRARIPRAEWNTCIMDVLDDAALKLIAKDATLPRSLTHYLVVSVRHRFLNLRRQERTRQAYGADAAAGGEPHEEPVVRSLCSEHSLRASGGAHAELHTLSRALRRLALYLAGGLSEQEWELLSYLGERVPLTRIAEWLKVSYDAAAQRSSRLRSRLRAAAYTHVTSFPPDEQKELQRFFERVRAGRSERKGRRGDAGIGNGGDAA